MPGGSIQCTVGILTFNSGATLRRALDSVKDFDDILICDGGSTDDTLAIAREFGARVIPQNPAYQQPDGSLKDYGGVRNQCLDAARYDWFLYIDSDEAVSPGLREEIRSICRRPAGHLVYRVPQIMIMDGMWIRYSSFYPAYQHRFFNRTSGARFGKPVHERIYFDREKISIGTLKYPWHTFRSREEWIHYFSRMRKYRDKEIEAVKDQTAGHYLRWTVWGNIRIAGGVCIKALYTYFRHGFKETLPVRGELGRVFSPLALMLRITWLHLWPGEASATGGNTRLYYIVNARMPTERAHGIQIAKMCDAFRFQGLDVTLVVPNRVGVSGDIFAAYRLSQTFPVVRLRVIDLLPFNIPGAFILETVSFALSARLWLLGKPGGVIYTRGEMSLFLAFLLPRRFSLVWETHIKPPRVWLYGHAVRRGCAIVAATRAYAEEIPRLWNTLPAKVLYEPDGVSLSDFTGLPAKEEARTQLRLPLDKTIILYAGSDVPWKGVYLLRQAATLLPDGYLTVFVGDIAPDGGAPPSQKKLYVGHQPYTQIPLWLAAADVLVLLGDSRSEIARRYTSPLKRFEYMASRRPIGAVDLPSSRDILSEDRAFLAAPVPEALAHSIEAAATSPNRTGLAEAAYRAVEPLDWQRRAGRILAFIRSAGPDNIRR